MPALRHTDLFIPSLVEVQRITGVTEPAAGAAAIRELGVRFAIVTDGPRGAWVAVAGG